MITAPTTEARQAPAGDARPALIARVFAHFIAVLERHKIAFALLGRVDGYPETIGSDVDFIVRDADLDSMPVLMQEVAALSGGRLVQCLQHEIGAMYYVIAVVGAKEVAFLPLDASGSYRRNGRLWLDADELLRQCRRNDAGHPVLAPCHAFAYYLVKRVGKRSLDGPRLAYLREEYARDPQGARQFIEARFGRAQRQCVHALLVSAEGEVPQALDALVQSLERATGSEAWAPRLSGRVRDAHRRWRRVTQPTGLVLGFLGPDGAGKSTLIRAVQAALAPAFRRQSYFHLRPGVLIRPRASAAAAAAAMNPHAQSPRGMLASIAKLCLLLAEYNAGWWVRVMPQKVRSSLVIFDRYFHDLLADPRRYRWAGPLWVLEWASKLMPQPDLWFVLDAPAEVLQRRKQEVSLEASMVQRQAYQRLAMQLHNAHLVDTVRDLNPCVLEICGHVLEHMQVRLQERLGLPVPRACA